jgi:hypothetical protein
LKLKIHTYTIQFSKSSPSASQTMRSGGSKVYYIAFCFVNTGNLHSQTVFFQSAILENNKRLKKKSLQATLVILPHRETVVNYVLFAVPGRTGN